MLHPEIEKLFDLRDAVAVVTGGATGIGYGAARRLAQAGADIVIADRDEARAQSAAANLGELGRRVLAVGMNVTEEAEVTEMIDRTRAELGGVDILVNNAGVFPLKRIADTAVTEWDEVMAVNLRGVFLCTREAARAMRAGGRGGRIVNVSSIESFHPAFPGLSHYNTSKSGVNLFTQSAALELARDSITVNAVCPGATLTEGTAQAFKAGMQAALEPRIPLKRVGTPEDIGAAILFLVSKAASYITGTTVVVDGGYLVT